MRNPAPDSAPPFLNHAHTLRWIVLNLMSTWWLMNTHLVLAHPCFVSAFSIIGALLAAGCSLCEGVHTSMAIEAFSLTADGVPSPLSSSVDTDGSTRVEKMSMVLPRNCTSI